MKEQLLKLQTKIDEMSLRERVLLFLSLIAVLLVIWSKLALDPVSAQRKQLLATMSATQNEIASLEKQTTAILQRSRHDPDEENRAMLAQYRKQVEQLEQQISSAIRGLIKPQEMARALEQVLDRKTGLNMVAVRSLGTRRLVETDPADADAVTEVAGVYRHGLQLEFEGSYLDALRYMHALQNLEWSFYWDSVDIVMDDYPRARIVITVHTLSLDEGWIGV